MAASLDQDEATLAAYRERAAALQAEIIACDVEEHEARRRAIRLDPTKRSDVGGANSEPGRIAKKRREREAALKGLLKEVAAFEAVSAERRQKDSEEALQREIKKARGFRLREIEDWKRIAAAWEELAEARKTYCENMTEADQHAHAVDHGGLLAAAPHLKDEWLTACRPVVQPVPTDFRAMTEKLYQASADPEGYGARSTEAGAIRKAGRVLPTLVNELSHLNKRLALQGMNELSGNFERSTHDRPKPTENYFEARSSAALEAAAEIAEGALA